MEKILVSACLVGEAVKYSGGHNLVESQLIEKFLGDGTFLVFCPEVEGGMPTPRLAAEIQGSGGGEGVLNGECKIVDKSGLDVTKLYLEGAYKALKVCREYKCTVALLKDGSPSCGSCKIYDGSFSSVKINGEGVLAALLKKEGVTIFNETEFDKFEKYVEERWEF